MSLVPLPPKLRAALDRLRGVARPRLVGGCVRDALWGLTPHDFDVEVGGITFGELQRRLAPLGATDVIGRSFGVIKLIDGNRTLDFSLPRRESKTGAGHRGFAIAPDPNLNDAEAAARRDFTLNAIAWDPFTDTVIDPLGGVTDLRARRLRHASAAFVEDPLRVLRAMQFAARFDLQLAPETTALAAGIADSFNELPTERVWGEWEKWATAATVPSRGLAVLEQTGWLRHFPAIAALRACPQDPAWHPEGDVLTHTAHCLDALVTDPAWKTAEPARRRCLSLAVLTHDFGKPATTVQVERDGQLRWSSPAHEIAGVEPTRTFLQSIGAPTELHATVPPLVQFHLAHHHGPPDGTFSANQVRRLSRRLHPATIDDLALVMRADAHGRPPRDPAPSLARVAALRALAAELALTDRQPRPILLGRHLIAAGMSPGPEFTPLLDAALEAQMDGAFHDEHSAVRWLEIRLQHNPPS